MGANSPLQTIGRRYVLHEQLGAGGMGVVYRASDRLTGQTVALKRVTMPAEQLAFGSRSEEADALLALAQEFKTLASLHHPHIIRVLDYGFDGQGQPFFTMSLLEGPQTIVAAGQGHDLQTQVDLLIQTLQALVYLHRRDVLHRDLKPENVLVVDGQVKVLDFGLSVMAARTMGHITQTTRGTFAYMAPELFTGAPITRSSDLYAVGVMAYEVLAGRFPYNDANMAVLLNDILNTSVDVGSIRVSDALAAVLERLLVKAGEERYDDAGQVIRDLCTATGCDLPPETDEIRESFLQAARFVGRDAELGRLSGALKDALAGRGSAILVGGESGVGKSRLADELRTFALVAGALVLRGQAISEGGSPYHLWRDVLRRLALVADLTVKEASVLKPLVPDIEALLEMDVPDAPPLDPQATQARLSWVVNRAFGRQERPTVVILEDLQWAGSESLALLDRLTQNVTDRSSLMIGTYRDDERPHLPDDLPGMQVLKLEPLTEQGVADLSASMLGPPGRQEPVVELLQRETEGNPFFVVEVVRALAEEAGHLDRVGAMALPASVYADGVSPLVRRRLKRVPEEARPLLQLAAVAGQALDLALLRALVPEVDLDRWLATCADAAVLEVGGGQWRFAHDKVRAGALDAIPEGVRPGLHLQVAEALEGSFPERIKGQAALLADHYARAEHWEKAQEWLFKAGDQAGQVAADAEALAHYQQALEAYTRAFGERWDPLQRATLERKMGEAFFRRGEHEQALAYLGRALAYLGRPLPASRWGVRIAMVKEIARQTAHRLLPALFLRPRREQADPVVEERVRIHLAMGWIDYFVDQANFLLDAFAILNLSERSGYLPGTVIGLAGLGLVCDFVPVSSLAEYYHRRAMALAQGVNDPAALAVAYNGSALHEFLVGQWKTAIEHRQRVADIWRGAGNLRGWAIAAMNIGTVLAYQGDHARAVELLQQVYQLGLEGDDSQALAWGIGWLGFAQWRAGLADASTAARGLTRAIELQKAIPDYLAMAMTMGDLGQCYLSQGKLPQALAVLEESHQLIVEHGLRGYQITASRNNLALAYLVAAEQAAGSERADWLRKARAACRAALKQGRTSCAGLPEAMCLQGRYQWLKGRTRAAERWWRRSLALAEGLGARYDLGMIHLEIGERLGERAHLERAEVILSEIGDEWDLARAREALMQTQVK